MSPSKMSSSRLRTTMCSGRSSALIQSINTCRPRGTADGGPLPTRPLAGLSSALLPPVNSDSSFKARSNVTSSGKPALISQAVRGLLRAPVDLSTAGFLFFCPA